MHLKHFKLSRSNNFHPKHPVELKISISSKILENIHFPTTQTQLFNYIATFLKMLIITDKIFIIWRHYKILFCSLDVVCSLN